MPTTSKKNLISAIAGNVGTKQVLVKAVVQQFLDEIIAELAKGNCLEFRSSGIFDTKAGVPRAAQNPRTLERLQTPAKRRVVFKSGRLMRKSVNVSYHVMYSTPTRREAAPVSKSGPHPRGDAG